MEDTNNPSSSAVAKCLASTSKATRTKALRLLNTWLTTVSSASLSEDDLLKIWKGLFYCMWHADKLPVQVELTNRLSSILPSLDLPLSARYLDAFLTTIRREWTGIDHLRVDKFYLLIRRFVNQFFVYLKNRNWEKGLVERMGEVLVEKTLLVVDKYPGVGVKYHIAEVYLEEMLGFLPLGVETIEGLINPFLTVMGKSVDKVLVQKIKVNVFDRLVENGREWLVVRKKGGEVEVGSEVEKVGKVALGLGFSKKLFDAASTQETVQSNRRVLFGLHNGFLKLEKDLENSGVVVSLEVVNLDGNDATLETLLPGQPADAAANGGDIKSDEKSSKKKLKKKSTKMVLKESSGKKNKKSSDSLDDNALDDAADDDADDATCTSTPIIADTDGAGDMDAADDTGDMDVDEAENGSVELLDETRLSNLQMQFEMVASEAGNIMSASSKSPKKRKRTKSKAKNIDGASGISDEKSVKKVRFAMKNNLIWKPQNPLPPQSLRLPPSTTPRGSALKKGLSPGPLRKSPPSSTNKKVKFMTKKKPRKIPGGVSPSAKRLRKMQSSSRLRSIQSYFSS